MRDREREMIAQLANDYVQGGGGNAMESWVELGLAPEDIEALSEIAAECQVEPQSLLRAVHRMIASAGRRLLSAC